MDYSYSFEGNIPSAMFNETSRNTLKWIEENKEKEEWTKDPNAYEMTNLFLFGAKYASEGKEVDMDTITKMWDIRSHDFERCNISENNFVYRICEDSYQAALSGKPMVNDENSHHALRKMAGLGLWLKQQQRDNGIISYNNPQELLYLLECSSTLKTFHPELFEEYAFDENINALYRLQLENEMPQEIVESIETAKEKIFKGINKESQDSQEIDIEYEKDD